MYRILLLHDQKRGNCRIKEYLELSGYSVDEEEMEIPQDIGRRILDWNLILLNCRDAGIYFRYVRNCVILRIFLLLF